MPEAQKAEHGAHLRLPEEAARLEKHIEHFKSSGDELEAAAYAERLKHTRARHVHAVKAAAFVDALGLKHEIAPNAITYNDALNFVAKTLHEEEHGVKTSTVARAHGHLKNIKGTRCDADGKVIDPNQDHVDPELLAAPRDAAAEVIAHLGLTDENHVAAAKALFQKATV